MRAAQSFRAGKRGLTLIEVMASLALMGSLLAALVMSHGRHRKQVRLAEKRIVALEIADRLLTQWTATWEPMRHGQGGSLPTSPTPYLAGTGAGRSRVTEVRWTDLTARGF